MTVLVTGSSGFIGSRLVKSLKEINRDVIGVDIRPSCTTDYQFDISKSPEKLLEVMKGVSHVIHLADISTKQEDLLEYWNVNVKGTYNVIDAMVKTGVPKIIFFSTGAIYGDTKNITFAKETDIPSPQSPFARSKLEAEKLILEYSLALDPVIIRSFNIAGGKEEPHRHLIPCVFEKLSQGKSPLVFGNQPTKDGTCIRRYLHVKDVNAFVILLLDNWDNKSFKIYNLSGFINYSILSIVERITDFWYNKRKEIISPTIVPSRKGDLTHSVSTCDRAFSDFSWIPVRNLADIISETYSEMFLEEN